MISKPLKKCKYCKNNIIIPLGIKMMGASKFCSIACIRLYNKKPIEKTVETGQQYIVGNEKQFETIKNDTTLQPGTKQEKVVYDRDPNYLAMIRVSPCIVCDNKDNNHAHHTEIGGKGLKGSDYSCVSLCHYHHTGGDNSVHKLGQKNFLEYNSLDLKQIIIEYLVKYIRWNNEK